MTKKVYVIKLIFFYLTILKRHKNNVRQGKNVESLHQVRVTTRRLRNAISFFKPILPKTLMKYGKEIRKIAKVSGDARDLDVQLEFLKKFKRKLKNEPCKSGIDQFIVNLAQKRLNLQPQLKKAIVELERNKTYAKIQNELIRIPDIPDDKFSKTVSEGVIKRLENILKFESYVYKPHAIEKLHQMRIAAKHLRYSLEGLCPLYGKEIILFIESVLKIHRTLGELHDFDVWIGQLSKIVKKNKEDKNYLKTIKYLHDYCRLNRFETYKKFINIWEELKKNDMEGKLIEFFS